MPRARLISPEFWTSEAVVDCAPMTRLLLLSLNNFADDFGVLPVRPRTLRLQVFPGDAIDDDQVRAMIEQLAARGLVRRYTVDSVAYLSIVDWDVHQRVGRRARRRYPCRPSHPDGQGRGTAAPELAAAIAAADESKPLQNASPDLGTPPPSAPAASPARCGEAADHDRPSPAGAASDDAADAAWHDAIRGALRRSWGVEAPDDLARHAARWRAEGRDLARDVLPAIDRLARVAVEFSRPLRLELADHAMTGVTPPVAMAQTMANHGNRPVTPRDRGPRRSGSRQDIACIMTTSSGAYHAYRVLER